MISDGRFGRIGALVSLMTTAGLVGWLSLLHWTLRIPSVPLNISDTIIRLTPGALATFAIDLLGPWAMRLLQIIGTGIMLGMGAGLGAWAGTGIAPARGEAQDGPRRLRANHTFRITALAGVALAATILVGSILGWEQAPVGLSLAILAVSYLGWAALTDWAISRWVALGAAAAAGAATRRRRVFLWQIAAATSTVAVGGLLAGQRLRPQPERAELPTAPQAKAPPPPQPHSPTPGASATVAMPTSSPAPSPSVAPLAATPPAPPPAGLLPTVSAPATLTPGAPLLAFEPVPGTRPNVTPVEDFYVVDIAAADPLADLNQWRLAVKGLIDRPLSLTFDNLLALPRVDVYGTVQCISDKIGGREIGTALFSGLRLRDVLRTAGPQQAAAEVILRSLDNYSESLPIDKALHEDTLLVYGMGGKMLAQEHGFPLRLYNPNHYGMKSPKWLKEVELVSEPYDGYWERSGWSKEATVQTTSVIDSPGQAKVENGVVRLGGIAFAGWRGIQEVGVQIDSGDFRPAVLDQPLGKSAWVRWRFDWQAPEPGSHRITVRAIDGAGEEQTDAVAPPHPEGATGRHRILIVI